MKRTAVKDVMVPVSEYATIPEEASLYEAVTALEKAQEGVGRTPAVCLHRAILVSDKNNQIVGKLSQLDVLKALEPRYMKMGKPESLSRSGFSDEFIKSTLEQYSFWNRPLEDMCKESLGLKVKNFMYALDEGEYVKESASLDEAAHLFVVGHHHSLLVNRGEEIVGILRLVDVFREIDQVIKACEPQSVAA
jgi:CBS domain-containing protein